jgi:hypothetical protein
MLGSGIDVISDSSRAVSVCRCGENACSAASARLAPSLPGAADGDAHDSVPPGALTAESVATELSLSYLFRM